MIYYISDIHFGDLNVFKKCSRPFSGLEELEKIVIKRWNDRIKKEDTVYVLGDIAKDNYIKVIDIFKILKGHKHLIFGNHDLIMLELIKKSKVFESVKSMMIINDNKRKVCLCHYPIMDWMQYSKGGYLVYGHIHNKTSKDSFMYLQIKEFYKDKPAYNAGVDVVGYKPVTLDEMIMLKEKNINEPYIN